MSDKCLRRERSSRRVVFRMYAIIVISLKYINVHVVLAIYCESPPPSDGATCSSNSTLVLPDPSNGLYPYGTAVAYSCLDGRKFFDGSTMLLVMCSGTGTWTETNVICQCKCRHVYYYFVHPLALTLDELFSLLIPLFLSH